jgi:hypothetical protein
VCGLKVGDEAVEGGFILRIGQREMDTIGVEIASTGATNAAYTSSANQGRVEARDCTHPPEAPVMSASLPVNALLTDIAQRFAGTLNRPSGL